MSCFSIEARDGASLARAGTLETAHGVVRTPAFVPLASTATVKGMLAEEVAAIGYEMVLGNTFHLMLRPGAELIQSLGGLHRFMGWERAIITDSGGFQVFSMGHGRVAEEIKGSRGHGGPAQEARGMVLAIDEQGVLFRSFMDGRELLLSPERSMQVQAALASDIALAFDECTPFHVDREYTESSTARTHRWLARCEQWRREHAPPEQLLYGIAQGGVYEQLRRDSVRQVAASGCDGVAIGGSLGASKQQMYEVVGWSVQELGGRHEQLPRHLLGIGEIDDLLACVQLGIDTFDCAMPTRIARHGCALVCDPEIAAMAEPLSERASRRFRIDLHRGYFRDDQRILQPGCPCPACARGLSRAYLSHLVRSHEMTAARLLCAHNLVFVERLMRDLRQAIADGSLAESLARWRGGEALQTAMHAGSR